MLSVIVRKKREKQDTWQQRTNAWWDINVKVACVFWCELLDDDDDGLAGLRGLNRHAGRGVSPSIQLCSHGREAEDEKGTKIEGSERGRAQMPL